MSSSHFGSSPARGWARFAGVAVVALGFSLISAGCAEEVFRERFDAGEIDYFDDLYAVTAVGSDHAWVAGYFGSIYRTSDAGKNWLKLPTDTQKSIYDISFADPKHGWAVGRRGYIISTRDGGDSWQRQSTPRDPAQHMFSVDAIDAQHAWIAGEWGGRYFTADGGKTWQDRSFVLTRDHPVFKYLTDFEVERFDAGETIYDDIYLNDVFFLDLQHGWMVGEYGFIFYTSDGGETWGKGKIIGDVTIDDFPFDVNSDEIPKERWSILFEAAERLNEKEYLRVRIEGFMTKAELAAAKGDTALADERAEGMRDFLEGEGVTQERLKLWNTTPFDQESTDMDAFRASKISETPQVRLEVLETPFLFDVKFQDVNRGLIGGLGGVILRSEDGGATWRYAESNSQLAFFGVGVGTQRAIAVGERGTRRTSADGGRTWQRLEKGFPEVFTFMRDITFGTGDRGWIVGATGQVLRSSDGGVSWLQVLPQPEDGVPDEGAGE